MTEPIVGNKSASTETHGRSCTGFPGSVFVLATWTKDFSSLPINGLEYRLLSSVVHAGLANVMRWNASIYRLVAVDNRSGAKLGKLVFVPICRLSLKFGDTLLKISTLVFLRAFRLNCRRLVLLQLQTNTLNLNDSAVEFLCGAGDLRIIPCGNSGAQDGLSACQRTESGCDVNHAAPRFDSSDSDRNAGAWL